MTDTQHTEGPPEPDQDGNLTLTAADFDTDGFYRWGDNLTGTGNLTIQTDRYTTAQFHGYIEAGGSIDAGGFIKASGSIEAGGSIKAGRSIKAGDGWGVFAGLSAWAQDPDRTVTCRTFTGDLRYGTLVITGATDGGGTDVLAGVRDVLDADRLPPPPADVTFPDVWVVPVSEVPVDGSVDIRTCPPCAGGRFGPWAHVVGEQPRVWDARADRSFLIDGLTAPWSGHLDQCVQVRRHTPHDRRAADAQWDAANGGL